ncbi:ribose ABC transporter substrate-binding protein RbsB [Brevibacillus laterosporus]|uniref:ribose ABC transporter substrate-binding protein RbsB n=1 Tax=Brevibacillus laterosporus TaxID=1465 RepID=UPI00264C9086|nr:ribose ABC transporter substrate-binding protein RbsB [Brevibacillus laterosporus]MDN9011782.1 ribose ABC transporter substrate-binding protein RbsB [Brevibacillus laterosporus]MDO0942782.1 ribose ABC transporter substrate-binding protein RbsB [Brevibacillus laterosporus]
MKKYMKVALASTMLLSVLAGCSTQSSLEDNKAPAPDAKKEGVTIGLSISTLNNPFFVTLKEGAEKAAKEAGVNLIVVDSQDDTAKQISGVEDLIQKKVDVILVNPTDSAAISTAVESANAANIPVVTVDRAAEGGKVTAHIASDNVKGGEMAGQFILDSLGGKGNVVELEGIPGSSAARDRGTGFHKAVDNKDGLKVTATQPADFNRAKGMSVMENILQGNKNIQAVFAHNDEMALGALQALEAAGLKEVKVVGFDATEDAVAAVKDGKLAATVAQKPSEIGKKAVETAIKVSKGEKVEEFIPVDLELIKK